MALRSFGRYGSKFVVVIVVIVVVVVVVVVVCPRDACLSDRESACHLVLHSIQPTRQPMQSIANSWLELRFLYVTPPSSTVLMYCVTAIASLHL
jgi:hypothetical protein